MSFHRILCLILLIFACGCSDPDTLKRIACSGQVKLDGKPVSGGNILLIPQSGQAPTAGGAIQPDGSFAFDTRNGPVAGNYKVRVTLNITAADERFDKRSAQDNKAFETSTTVSEQVNTPLSIELSSKSKRR